MERNDYMQILKYLDFFKDGNNSGKFVLDSKSKGTLDDPKQAAYVSYNSTIHSFIRDSISFAEMYFEVNILDLNYLEMFKPLQPKIKNSVNYDDLSECEVVLYLIYIVRRERFAEGLLKMKISDGTIYKLLNRLSNCVNERGLE